jgi:hypothetical protein
MEVLLLQMLVAVLLELVPASMSVLVLVSVSVWKQLPERALVLAVMLALVRRLPLHQRLPFPQSLFPPSWQSLFLSLLLSLLLSSHSLLLRLPLLLLPPPFFQPQLPSSFQPPFPSQPAQLLLASVRVLSSQQAGAAHLRPSAFELP